MKITAMGQQNGWMSGTIEGGYEWEAKVYREPSEFGINGGPSQQAVHLASGPGPGTRAGELRPGVGSGAGDPGG